MPTQYSDQHHLRQKPESNTVCFYSEGLSYCRVPTPHPTLIGIVTVLIFFHLPEYLEGDDYANLLSFNSKRLQVGERKLPTLNNWTSICCSVQNCFQQVRSEE